MRTACLSACLPSQIQDNRCSRNAPYLGVGVYGRFLWGIFPVPRCR